MDGKSLLYIVFILLGLIVYKRKPNYFMIYWLSARAFLFPIFLFIFHFNTLDSSEVYNLYYSQAAPLIYVMAIIMLLTIFKSHFLDFGRIKTPLIVLVSFIIIQNILVGFDVGALSKSIKELMFLVITTLTLCSSVNIRPQQSTLIKFIILFICIEAVFCFLNTQGIRLYNNFEQNDWEDNLISGTFPRYSHMTNFLTTFYLILAISYYGFNIISKRIFYFVTLLLAAIILASGAKISVILFFFVIGSCIVIYERKNVFKLVIFGVIICISTIMLVGKYNNTNMDQSIGIERNITGLVDLFSNRSTDGNTLSLSEMVLISCNNNPTIGNGMANRESSIYDFDSYPESIIKADARLAFMFVEYGVIGCLLFIFLFCGIFKTNMLKSSMKDRKVWLIITIYYILFTFTESGIFDSNMLTILSVYALCIKDNKKVDINNLLRL